MSDDPTHTDPELYKVVFENDRVRVLEYKDVPGDRTNVHRHPDSVMITLSDFQRELTVNGQVMPVEKKAHEVGWLPGQEHIGHNVGTTPTHVMFVELK